MVPLSSPLVGSGRLALSSGFVLQARFFLPFFSKKRRRPRAPTQGPVFRRGDDPRTDLQSGIPKYVRHDSGIGSGCWLLTLVFISSLCRLPYLRSSVQTHRWGLVEEPPRVERALRGGGSSFLSFSRGAHAPRHKLGMQTSPSIFFCVVQANDLQYS